VGKTYSDCRRRWLAGQCPCCGIGVDDDDVVIAEGVRLCMLCEMRRHHRDPEHVARILEALLPS
jgi:hypothetical protein